MRCYIYQARNKINGKIYVGFTRRELIERIKEHAYNALNGSAWLFHRALRKHGIQAFEWSILHESDDEIHCLTEMEPHFIQLHKSFGKHGYNMTSGGDGGPTLAGEANPMFGRTHTPEARRRIGDRICERLTGRSYDELYGAEKAMRLRNHRSEAMKEHCRSDPHTGAKNPNFDHTEYSFINNDGRAFTGTIYALRQHDPSLTKENTKRIKKLGTSKGWKLT